MHDSFDDVPEVSAREAYAMWTRGEASLVDVRELSEWDLGHIEGSRHLPLGQLPLRWRELDPEKKWICVCHIGQRSYYAAAMLRQAGVDASSLDGGMVSWHEEKLPITDPGIVD